MAKWKSTGSRRLTLRHYEIQGMEETINLNGGRPNRRYFAYAEDGETWTGTLDEAQHKCGELNRWANTDTKYGMPQEKMRSYRPIRAE